MAERTTARAELDRVERRLTSWRAQHGGRGRPIPEELWRAATEVAAIAGVRETARVLGVDRERLARRVATSTSAAPAAEARSTRSVLPAMEGASFVEVDARQVFTRSKALIRLTSRDGEQLEIEVEGGATDVATVARAFWERAR